MKLIATIIVAIVVPLALCNVVYASEYQMTGNGAAVANGNTPKLYPSLFRMTLSDQSTITKGTFLVYGDDLFLHAYVLPQNWSFLYNNDGSFHGQGTVQTTSGDTLNVTLDGSRVYATNSGSLWKVDADMQGGATNLLLDYLVTGTDPAPTVDVSSNETVIIPNGNSAMANKGFFVPLNAEIFRGTTVTWQNEDNIGHTVQSQDGQGNVIPMFNSGILNTGDTFSYKFDKPGVYHYFCTIHPWRIGVVTVS